MLGIFERNYDNGDSYLIDNFVVLKGVDLNDPYETHTVIFEGTKHDCQDFIEFTTHYQGNKV